MDTRANNIALAVAAHPDDIEFMMAGALILLGQAGWQLHVMHLASGSCGTATMTTQEIAPIRAQEARQAAAVMGAVWHGPLVDDIEVLYELPLLRRLAAVIREVRPTILLVPNQRDYMEDHVNTSRLAVTAAFCRNMPNFATLPPVAPTAQPMAVYHALPYGLLDSLRQRIHPDIFVDIGTVMAAKRQALACHASQRQWLDDSQGIDSYIRSMESMAGEVGRMSGRFACAEGWCRHNHLGFADEAFDPLRDALAGATSARQDIDASQ